MGHEDAGCRFRKETIAGMRRRGPDPEMHVQHAGHELVELQVVKELAVPLQRPLFIDCLHALEEAVTLLDIPFVTDLSGGSMRSKDARGLVIGDDAEHAFAMISLWEGART
jgi:hypothetical protein